uniref:Zn(2)-C6 fungal-type domain-containing protein n=2 Tax=Kalmanozyma brasiliensis (strain GHG001) TaxID=1365824 RepID=V5E5S0_KALBG
MSGPSTHAEHPSSVRPPPKHLDAPLKNGSAASAAAAAAAEAAAAAAAAEKKISCMECRLSKVKCSGGDLCTRCKRLGKECYYKSHKRGRKSDSSKIQKLERTVDSLSRALEQFSRNKGAGSPTSGHTLSKSVSVDSKRNARLHAPEENDNSSPDSFWKSVEASRAPAPPSNSAMSPPSQSPRANGSATYRDQNNAVRSRPSDLHRQRSASSSWQTPKSIASATPTSDDPDEPENLGLPTLSNPLKLLAHASDSARDGEPGAEVSDPSSASDPRASEDNARSTSGGPANHHSGSAFNADGTVSSPGGQDPSSSGQKGDTKDHNGKATLFGVYQGLNKTNTVTRFGPGRGKAFFDVGLFSTKPDNLPQFDPVDRGYLSLAEAESLYSVYIQYINPTITLLDPHLHTFDYVRSCSSLLLSCTCWIAAKYKVEGSQIADDLEMHIRSNLLPTILMEGFRNAEIPQALIILAAYHPQMNTLSEDKAWTYLGFAIRIASELDMNSRIAVRPPNRQDEAGLARRLRNRERTWLNLWLYETSMSQQMGRRPTLANDPVVLGCAHWHLDPFALEQDKAVVAVVQLRLLMKRNTELFENFVDISTSPLSAERTAKHVELFRRICASDLDAWLATWTAPSNQQPKQPTESLLPDTETGGYQSSANREADGNGELPPTHPRTNRLKLYYWYARLALDAIALKCSHLGLDVLRPVYRDAYACCMAYLGLFVATMVPNGLFWGHNSAVVTPAYCAIFALKIVGLISTTAGAAGASALTQRAEKVKEEDLGIDIDAEYTFEMVEKLAKACEEAGNATPHRRAAAGSYAFFLFTVLAKAKSAWNAKLGIKDGNGEESRAKGRKRDREGNDGTGRQSKSARNGKSASRDRQQKERVDQNGDTTLSDAAPGSANANGDQADQGIAGADASVDGDHLTDQQGGVGGTDSDHHFLRQLMQFQAGPSGVQTAIVHDASNQEPHHLYGFPQQHHYANFASNPISASHMAPMPFDANMSTMAASNAASAAFGAATGTAGVGPDGATGEDGTGAAAQGVVDIDWDFGMLDGFLGESLFSDMSFISASATPANMNGVNGA